MHLNLREALFDGRITVIRLAFLVHLENARIPFEHAALREPQFTPI